MKFPKFAVLASTRIHHITRSMQRPHLRVCSQKQFARLFLSELSQRSFVRMLACTTKAWEKVQALRKDNIPPRGEPHPKSAMCSTRAPIAKHAFCAGVPKHTFRCNGRAEDRKRSSALTAFLAQSISFPHGRNILLLLGYPVKNV